jgi:hypothetical protein
LREQTRGICFFKKIRTSERRLICGNIPEAVAYFKRQ